MFQSLTGWFSILSLRQWLKSSPVIVFSARISIGEIDSSEVFRFTFATRTTLYADAEEEAHRAAQQTVRDLSPSHTSPVETKWHKGRVVNNLTLNEETEAVVRIIADLKEAGQHSISHMERTRTAARVAV